MKSIASTVTVALLGVGLLVCSGCGQSAQSELSRKFVAAGKAFEEASNGEEHTPDDFLRVAGQYQEILDDGGVCGAVLYNQGNAFMLAGCRGRAIAAYRQAKRYWPNYRELDHNLAYALGTDSSTTRKRPMIEHLMFWQNWLSYQAKIYLAAAAAAVTFGLGLLALFVRRRMFTHLAAAAAVVTLLLAFSAGYDWYRYDCVRRGVIVRNQVTARKGNADSYEPAFTEPLSEGAEFRVLKHRGDWLQIRLSGGQKGWIKQDAAAAY